MSVRHRSTPRSRGRRRLLEPHRRPRRSIVPGADAARALPQLPGVLRRRRGAARRRCARRLSRRADGAFRRSRHAAEDVETRSVVIFRVGVRMARAADLGRHGSRRICCRFTRCRTGRTVSCSAWPTSAASCWSASRSARSSASEPLAAASRERPQHGVPAAAGDPPRGRSRGLSGRRGARHPPLPSAGIERRARDRRQGDGHLLDGAAAVAAGTRSACSTTSSCSTR